MQTLTPTHALPATPHSRFGLADLSSPETNALAYLKQVPEEVAGYDAWVRPVLSQLTQQPETALPVDHVFLAAENKTTYYTWLNAFKEKGLTLLTHLNNFKGRPLGLWGLHNALPLTNRTEQNSIPKLEVGAAKPREPEPNALKHIAYTPNLPQEERNAIYTRLVTLFKAMPENTLLLVNNVLVRFKREEDWGKEKQVGMKMDFIPLGKPPFEVELRRIPTHDDPAEGTVEVPENN